MGIFKDDDKEMEANMGDFDDANVDKDLLSQIFADGGEEDLDQVLADDSENLDDDLDELLNEIENIEEAAKASVEKEAEVKASADAKKEKKDTSKKDNKKKEVSKNNDTAAVDQAQSKAADAVTVISEGTTISGGITSDGSIEVMGTINGDIEAKGKVSVNGTVSGSVIASEIIVNTPRLEGSLNSEGNVQVGSGTVVIGDITGVSAYIAGAVKGSIDISGSIVLEDSAVVKGDINAKSIQINDGAIMDGRCILSYSDINIDSIFEEKK